MFEQLLTNPFLYSLSLTLLHFLWQGLLVATVLKSALLIIDKSKSRLRYALSGFAMLANLIFAISTFLVIFPDKAATTTSNIVPIPLTNLVNELTQQNPLIAYQELFPSILAYSLPYIALLWLISISALACKLLIEVRNVNHLPKHAYLLPNNELLNRFNTLAKQIKLTKTPKLLISLKVDVPMAIGWLKPVVLLPASMVTGLDSAQLEMLLLHELAHIRRYDYAVNFLQTVVEILFFFHPSVTWVAKQMRNEREYCSDDIAVQHCGDPIAYAHTLADTATLCAKRHSHTIPNMAMAASGGDLKERVLRLVDHHCAPSNNMSKWLAAISIMLSITLIFSSQIINNQLTISSLSKQWQGNSPILSSISDNDQLSYSSQNNNTIAQQLLKKETIVEQLGINALEKTSKIIPNQRLKVAVLENNSNPNVINNVSIEKQITIKKPQVSAEKIKTVTNTLAKTVTVTEAIPKQTLKINQVDTSKSLPKLVTNIQNTKSTLAKNKIDKRTLDSTALPKQFKASEAINDVITRVEKAIDKPTVNDALVKRAFQSTDDSYNSSISQNSYQRQQETLASFVTDNSLRKATQSNLLKEKIVWHDAKRLNSVDPIYPSLAKRKGIEIEVKVHFTIDEYGQVKDIKFAQQNRVNYFKSAIRTAIRKWRFLPAQKNEQAIESQMSKIFSFSLQA